MAKRGKILANNKPVYHLVYVDRFKALMNREDKKKVQAASVAKAVKGKIVKENVNQLWRWDTLEDC